jgi:hypothetical protein
MGRLGKATHSFTTTFTADVGYNPNNNTTYVGGGYDADEGVGINLPAKAGYFPILDYALAIYKCPGTAVGHAQILIVDNNQNTIPLIGRTCTSADGMDSMVLEFDTFVVGRDMTSNVIMAMTPPTADSRVIFINASGAGLSTATAPFSLASVCRFSVGWHYEQAAQVLNP